MACVTQSHPFILRNSLIFILRYLMAQKSDEVRKRALSPPSLHAPCLHTKKTDYLSALYMQHGSKPQESLSPAALYSHDDTWGKGKGGAVRRKKYSETGHNSNKTVEKWAQKQQRVAAAGCRMSGIGRRGDSGAAGDVGRYQPRRRTHTTNFLVHTTMRAKTMRTERIRAGGMPSAA